MYRCVNMFCYLGDTLDGDGETDLAATTRKVFFSISNIQSSPVGDEVECKPVVSEAASLMEVRLGPC